MENTSASKAPEKFEVSNAGIQEIVNVINELIPGKYSKQTVFNVLNQYLVPVQKPVLKPTPQSAPPKEVRKMPTKK